MATQSTEKRNGRILTNVGSQLGASGPLGLVLDLDNDASGAVTISWDGTPTGVFKVQVSNVPGEEPPSSDSDWDDVVGATATASGAPGRGPIDVRTGFRWMRVYYTRTSGNGGCQIDATIKSMGGG